MNEINAPNSFFSEDDTLEKANFKVQMSSRNCLFLGQLLFQEKDLAYAKDLVVNLIDEIGISKATIRFERFYPGVLSSFLLLVGIYKYSSGNFWDNVWEYVGKRYSNYQSRWGNIFLEFVQKNGLESFFDKSNEYERSYRYVNPILLHGGIPYSCLNDFFEYLLVPAVTRVASENVSEIIDELYSNSSAFERVTKPVKYFFQKGRAIAEHYLAEAINLYETIIINKEETNQHSLPKYVLDAFYKWSEQVSDKQEYRERGIRFRGPWIQFQPYGAGVCLYFPRQEIRKIDIYDAELKVEFDNKRETYPLETEENVINELTIPLVAPCSVVRVTLIIDGESKNIWQLKCLSEDNPWIIFREKDGRQIRPVGIKDTLIWVLLSSDFNICESDDDEGIKLPRLIEICSGLPFEWRKFRTELLDLEEVEELVIKNKFKNINPVFIPVLSSLPEPLLERKSDIKIPGNLRLNTPIYTTDDIKLSLPGAKKGKLDDWNISLVYNDDLQMNSLLLSNLEEYIEQKEDGFYLQLVNSKIITEIPGKYKIRIRTRFGLTSETSFIYLPNYEIIYPEMDDLWPDEEGKFHQVHIFLRSPEGDRILVEGNNHIMDTESDYLSGIRNHMISISEATPDLSLRIVGYRKDQKIDFSILLPVRPLSWQIVQEGRSLNTWCNRQQILSFKEIETSATRYIFICRVAPFITKVSLVLKGLENDYHSEAQNPDRDGFVRFDLNSFNDDIRHGNGETFAYYLVLQRGEDFRTEFPAVIIEYEWQVKYISINAKLVYDHWQINCNWQETEAPNKRSLQIEDMWRPWKPKKTFPIDRDLSEVSINIPKNELPPSIYQISFSAKTGWGSKEIKPSLLEGQLDFVIETKTSDFLQSIIDPVEDWVIGVMQVDNEVACIDDISKFSVSDQKRAISMLASCFKSDQIKDSRLKNIYLIADNNLSDFIRLLLFVSILKNTQKKESKNYVRFAYYSGLTFTNFSSLETSETNQLNSYLVSDEVAPTMESLDLIFLLRMVESWYPLAYLWSAALPINSVSKIAFIKLLQSRKCHGVEWLRNEYNERHFEKAIGPVHKLNKTIEGRNRLELKGNLREFRRNLDWFDENWTERTYIEWKLKIENKIPKHDYDQLYNKCNYFLKILLNEKANYSGISLEGRRAIKKLLEAKDPGESAAFGCKAYYSSLIIALIQRIRARRRLGRIMSLWPESTVDILCGVAPFYERNLCLAEMILQYYER